MKKIISVLLISCFVFMVGCGDSMIIPVSSINSDETIRIETYGLFNEDEMKHPNIKYRVIFGNVVWSIILIETIIAPVYFIGYSIFEPIDIIEQN